MNPTNDTILVRFVQLTLDPLNKDAFIEIFDAVSPQIRSFDGCEYLELLQNPAYPNIFSTYSHWDSQASLDQYRKSDLFVTTWAKTKKLFVAPPQAVSYQRIRRLP